MPRPNELAIGVDVGATKIAAALVDPRGNVITERRTDTLVAEGPPAVVQRIADIVQTLLKTSPARVAGVGVGTPGYVDPSAGVVTNAVNLNWNEFRLVDALCARLGDQTPILVENDANAMALGEYHYGAAQGCANFVYACIGSGLGSGIVIDRRLVSGADFRAAELGHLSLDPAGRQCACGLRGCVETVVSGPGILATAKELLAESHDSALSNENDLTPEHVLHAACHGDALALAAFDYTAAWLGQALSACVALLNPERIIIGGGVGLAALDLLVPGVQNEFQRRLIPLSYAKLSIVRSLVNSSAVGASSLVWHAQHIRHAI